MYKAINEQKVECCECGNKFQKGFEIKVKISTGKLCGPTIMDKDEMVGHTIRSKVRIEDFPFCPFCFFIPITTNPNKEKCDEARLNRRILKEDKVKVKSIVVRDEFDNYIDCDLETFKSLGITNFFDFEDDSDDHNSNWGGAGPDCINGRLATALK